MALPFPDPRQPGAAVPQPPPTQSSFLHEIIAGFTVFVTISYILVANPLILSQVKMDPGAVLFGTFLGAGIASIVAGMWARTPTSLAPGMAFNAFFVSFCEATKMPWDSALLLCGIGGIVVFLLSVTGARLGIIEAIPTPLRTAVTGGIGAILAEAGIKLLRAVPENPSSPFVKAKILAFCVGLAVIIGGFISVRALARDYKRERNIVLARVLDLIGRSAFLLSVGATFAVAVSLNIPVDYTAPRLHWVWSDAFRGWEAIIHDAAQLTSVSFVIFLVYMLMVDIVGSPYEFADRREASFATTANRGFYADSLANIFAPILGTSPIIYYAENHAARVVGARGGLTAVTVGFLFLLVFAFAIVWGTLPAIPQVAVAPALFAVGLIVISNAIGVPDRIERQDETSGLDATAEAEADRLPAGLTIVLTPIAGLEYGLAAGVVTYYVQFVFVPAAQRDAKLAERGPLHILALLAFVAIVVRLLT